MSSTPSATKAKRAHQIVRRELLRLIGRLSATYGEGLTLGEVQKIMDEKYLKSREELSTLTVGKELPKDASRATD